MNLFNRELIHTAPVEFCTGLMGRIGTAAQIFLYDSAVLTVVGNGSGSDRRVKSANLSSMW